MIISANSKLLQVPFSFSRLVFWWAGNFSSNLHYRSLYHRPTNASYSLSRGSRNSVGILKCFYALLLPLCTFSHCLVHAMQTQSLKIDHLSSDASIILKEQYSVSTFSVTTQCWWHLCQGPFSISYLEAQVTWNFSYKSLDRFLSSLQLTWKPSHLAKSQVTSVADLGRSNIVICISYLFLNQYMWHYMICFITYLIKAIRILFIEKLGVWCHRLRQASWASWVVMVLHSVTSL